MPLSDMQATASRGFLRLGRRVSHALPMTVLALIGFAPYWFLLRRPGLFYSLAGHDGTTVAAVGWYLVHLASVVLSSIVAVSLVPGVKRRCGEKGCGRSVFVPLAALFTVQAGLKMLEVSVDLSGVLGFVVALVDTVSYGAVVVALTCMWACWCTTVSARRAAVVAIGSFALSFFVKLVGLLVGPVAVALTALMPMLSFACWSCLAVQDLEPDGAAGACLDSGRGIAAIDGPVRGTVAILAAFLIAGGAFRGIAFGMVSGKPLDPAFSLQDVVSVSFAVLVLAYYLAHASMLRLPWFVVPLSLIIFFAGLLFMMVFADDQPAVGGNIVVMGRTSLGLVFWIVLVDVARSQNLSAVKVFGVLFVLIDVVSSLLGYVIVPFVVASLGFSLGDATAVLASVVAFALMAVPLVLLGRTLGSTLGVVDAAGDGGVADATDAAKAACSDPSVEDLSNSVRDGWLDAYGLTEREVAVASLLAKGNSQRKIADILHVSIGTVQTHVKNVYRKLDIHSRQELIDLAHGETR